jgi:hypothetical protein
MAAWEENLIGPDLEKKVCDAVDKRLEFTRVKSTERSVTGVKKMAPLAIDAEGSERRERLGASLFAELLGGERRMPQMRCAPVGDVEDVHRIRLEALSNHEATASKCGVVLMRRNDQAAYFVGHRVGSGAGSRGGRDQIVERPAAGFL